jgi:hypothetical protein
MMGRFGGWREVVLAASIAGCGGRVIELEHADGGTADVTTGGTAGSSATGAAAGLSSGGSVSGAGGTAGSGANPPGSVDFTSIGITCDYAPVLKKCASIGCHNSASMQSGLILTPDVNLVGRLKDVPAKFGGINCAPDGQGFTECTTPPAACDVGALLVNSSDWQKSYILTKLHQQGNDCGEPMPYTYQLTDLDEQCLELVVFAIALAPAQ